MYALKTIDEQLEKQQSMWLDANGYFGEEKDELIELCQEQTKRLQEMRKAVSILTDAKQSQIIGSINCGNVLVDLVTLKKKYRELKTDFEDTLEKQEELVSDLQDYYDSNSDADSEPDTDSEELASNFRKRMSLAKLDEVVIDKKCKMG